MGAIEVEPYVIASWLVFYAIIAGTAFIIWLANHFPPKPPHDD